jgi:transposase-like protein
MRYPASEKLEIIRTVETSHLPVRRTLDKIGIPKTTFYAWLDRYAAGGFDALEDHRPRPRRVWNRIPDGVRERIVQLALDEPDRSPREIAVAFTDRERSFVSEASVYRLLKARGLVTSPAFIVMKAADRFANPTTAINQLWQTDFTYLKSPAGAGSTCRPSSTTSHATSSPGNSVRRWRRTMSPRRWISPCRHQVSIRPRSIAVHGCSPITARRTSRTICPTGSRNRECGTPAANPITR